MDETNPKGNTREENEPETRPLKNPVQRFKEKLKYGPKKKKNWRTKRQANTEGKRNENRTWTQNQH